MRDVCTGLQMESLRNERVSERHSGGKKMENFEGGAAER